VAAVGGQQVPDRQQVVGACGDERLERLERRLVLGSHRSPSVVVLYDAVRGSRGVPA